ncbi:MAG: ArsR/SmtB family transcription factor [Phycisphaerales bacterium]
MNQLTDIANALSDPNRIRLLAACLDRERCVCQLVELIDLSNASISKHLSMLKRAGLLESRKEGRWVHYRSPEVPTAMVRDAIALITSHALNDGQLIADRDRLVEIDAIEPIELAKMQRQGCCLPKLCCTPKPKGTHHENQ